MQRCSGIILPIFSLPSPYGIGTMGKAAFRFADFLAEAGVAYWQILPVCPVGDSNSPYQSPSVFAGNPLFIDLDLLAEEGLLKSGEYNAVDWGSDPGRVDYARVKAGRAQVLRLAFERGWRRDESAVKRFRDKNAYWIEDYAMYMAMEENTSLDADARQALMMRSRSAIHQFRDRFGQEINYWVYLQYLFMKQWQSLRDYLAKKGIRLIGDLPIYVSAQSADVWAHSDLFQLDAERRPAALAGCPPDYFSPEGQNWGNPLYNWDKLKKQNYRWWHERVARTFELCDVVRFDHFRGFESYYSIPADSQTAQGGHWEPGPGIHFFRKLTQRLGKLEIIAEDLGTITPEVHALRRAAGYPGMAVLQFAFEGGADNLYLPHNITADTVMYTGTHDNDTIAGWLAALPEWQRAYCRFYTRFGDYRPYWDLIGTAWATVAPLAVAQMQDFLGLDSSCRMNTPSVAEGNWEWRAAENQVGGSLAHEIRDLNNLFGR